MIHDIDVQQQHAIQDFLTAPCEEKFRALFQAIYRKVLGFFRARGLDFETAEELGQNVLFKVYQRASDLRDRNRFGGWLFRIAKNELLQHRRRHSHDVISVDCGPESGERASWTQEPVARSEDSRFLDWMTSLEPQERRIMMLRYLEELEYQEIATVLDLPLGTVKWKIFRSKSKLAVLLRERAVKRL